MYAISLRIIKVLLLIVWLKAFGIITISWPLLIIILWFGFDVSFFIAVIINRKNFENDSEA